MHDKIFRVRVSPDSRLRMRAQPAEDASVIARLSNRQAVVRLDMADYDGWYFVFADTPGDGLFVGYISAAHLTAIDADIADFGDDTGTGAHRDEEEGASDPPTGDDRAEAEAPPQPSAPPPDPVPTDPRLIQLSDNFTLWEFISSNAARDRGLDNSPSPDELAILQETARNMEAVRTLLGSQPIRVNSAFRSQAVNEAVGGVSNSSHRLGYAVDFVCPNFGTPFEICQVIAASPLMDIVDQLIQERNRWVHISFDPRRRKQTLSYFIKDGDKRYFSGLFETDPRNEQ